MEMKKNGCVGEYRDHDSHSRDFPMENPIVSLLRSRLLPPIVESFEEMAMEEDIENFLERDRECSLLPSTQKIEK